VADNFPLCKGKPSRATTKSTLFTVSKDEWNTKEDAGKSLKNALHVLLYAKRHFSAKAMSNSENIKPVGSISGRSESLLGLSLPDQYFPIIFWEN